MLSGVGRSEQRTVISWSACLCGGKLGDLARFLIYGSGTTVPLLHAPMYKQLLA